MARSAVDVARPDSDTLADLAGTWASAYVHVPFCARVCPYCDFAVVAGRDDLAGSYLEALRREILAEPAWRPLDAVFVGGGTPSRLAPSDLGAILATLEDRFGLVPGAEVTLEANPEDWSPAMAEALREAGFTRVSFGAQSFDPAVLETLGRRHAPSHLASAVEEANAAGFRSVSIDLIYGAPGESLSSWERSVNQAVSLDVDHVSAYALTVERGTELSRQVRAGAPPPDPDVQADCWELAQEVLGAGGYIRYEVSNWARPGHHCRYNLSVWGRGEYAAFGAGAHSFRDGVRARNVRRIEAYIERLRSGVGPAQSADAIGPREAEIERLMLGLRRTAGVAPGIAGPQLLESASGRRLVDAGVLAVDPDRLRVARPLLTDEVIRAVLALET